MNDATASNTTPNLAAGSPIFVSSTTPTPGWKTSEFWMTAIGQVGLVLAATSGALPTKYAVIAGALSQVAYSVSRGLAKSGAASAAA